MKALILAAGYGKRLRPVTDTIPKAMVKVKDTPLLFGSLDKLKEAGVSRIGIVTGHMSEYIRNAVGSSWQGIPIEYYENSRYMETNNIYSVYKALDFFDDDMLMLECDILYDRQIIDLLLESGGECAAAVSPYDADTMDGTVLLCEGNRVSELVLGKWQGEDFDYSNAGKTVNIYKFKKDFAANKFGTLIKWYVENIGSDCYYEKMLGALIYCRECDFRAVNVPKELWYEIDTEEDIKRAENAD